MIFLIIFVYRYTSRKDSHSALFFDGLLAITFPLLLLNGSMFVAVILTAGTLGLCLLDSLDNKRYALTEKYNKAYVKALDIINGFPLKDRFRVKLLNFNL